MARSIQTHVDAPSAGFLKEGSDKIRLREHLSTADGHTAACVFVKPLVLLHLIHNFLNRHSLCHRLEGICIAAFDAEHTLVAEGAVDFHFLLLVHIDCMFRTLICAVAALNTAFRHFDDLLLKVDQFRVMAPEAVQRTAPVFGLPFFSRAAL